MEQLQQHHQPPPLQPQPQQPPQAPHSHFAVANPSPPPPVSNPSQHPPYADMITAAIVWDNAQGKEGGSSKRAIAKYIERVYANLPSGHDALLTHHLKRMKSCGQLTMVKNSYQLPSALRSAPTLVPPGPTPAQPSPKRRPGRPAKAKAPELAQIPADGDHQVVMAPEVGTAERKRRGRPPKQQQPQQAQVFVHEVAQAQPISQANGQLPGAQKRRPGRPPKSQAHPVSSYAPPATAAVPVSVAPPAAGENGPPAKRRPGRPSKAAGGVVSSAVAPAAEVSGGGVVVVKKRGWPKGKPRVKRLGSGLLGPVPGVVGKRRGRPPKAAGSWPGVGMGMKRRGRPPKGSRAPTVSRSGRPLGRPRKDAMRLSYDQGGKANEELVSKLELLQSKIRDAVAIIRPHVANDDAAFTALQQLEELASVTTATATPPPLSSAPVAESAAPPLNTMPATVTESAPPPAQAMPVSMSMAPATAPPTAPPAAPTVTAPPQFPSAPAAAPGPFTISMQQQPMSVSAPFYPPSSAAENQQQQQPFMSWLPPSGAQ